MPPEPTAPRKEIAIIAGFLIALAAYGALFFQAVADRGLAWLIAFIPDQVLLDWIGGDAARIGLADRLFVASFASLILLLAWFSGGQTLKLFVSSGWLTRLETGVFSIGVGLSELSLLTLLLGIVGALHDAWAFWLAFVTLAAAKKMVGRWTERVAQESNDERATPRPDRTHPGETAAGAVDMSVVLVALLLGAPFLLLIVLGGMMPPWEFDVREYHLQVPKEWYQAGRVEFLPHNVYGNMPLGAEMHAVLGMILTAGWADWWWGALVGKTVMASFAPLTALGLFAAVRRHAGTVAAGTAAVVYLSIPWVIYVSMTGLNEGAVACYALLAVAAMLRWQDRSLRTSSGSGSGMLALAGLLAGSAAACKYPALVFIVVPLAAWSGLAVRGPGARRSDGWGTTNPFRQRLPIFQYFQVCWRPMGIFLLAALVFSGPWYAKNLVFTGNPFYPLVFGGATRTPELVDRWNRAHQVPRDDQGRRYTPVQAAESMALLAWRSRWISPILLPLAALAWLRKRDRRLVVLLSVLILWIILLWWLATHRIDRFLVPLLPWAAWLAGIGFVWSDARLWRRIATTVLVAAFFFNFLDLLSSGHYDRRLLVALDELRHDRPEQPGGPSRVSMVHRYLNQTVPAGKRVLLVGDAQPFDLEVPVLYHTCFDPCIFELWMRDRSAEQRRGKLQDERISHIYFDWGEIARYRSPGNYGFTDWVTRELIWQEFVQQQAILRPVPLDVEAARGELFEVVERSAMP